MWWLIGVVIVGYIIYTMIKDRNEDVQAHVTDFGGMQVKYRVLIEYFMQHPSARITRLTSDHVTIESQLVTVHIDYVSSSLEISLKSVVPLLGNISKKWKYPSSYSQELIIQEIENYFEWNMKNMEKVLNNKSYGDF